MAANSHLPWGAHLGKNHPAPSSPIIVVLSPPTEWNHGHEKMYCFTIQAYKGKWKHVTRMSCLGFALLLSSVKRWEVGREEQHTNRKIQSQQNAIRTETCNPVSRANEAMIWVKYLTTCFKNIRIFEKHWSNMLITRYSWIKKPVYLIISFLFIYFLYCFIST